MKTMITTSMLPVVTCLVVFWRLSALAQGVVLSPGDTLTIGFNGVDACRFTEGAASGVQVFFGADMLTSGESLRLEMYENTLNDVPFATQTFSPASPFIGVSIVGPTSPWHDYQGLIRVSMLSGSTEVRSARFFISPSNNNLCDAFVTVPEPIGTLLGALGIASAAALGICRRTGLVNAHSSSDNH